MKTMQGVNMINASAGSGKTHRLTEEVMDALFQGILPESLAVTTFTNKAASELKERIHRQLLDRNMQDEALRVFDGFIGTVNAICARLLKEYALSAGLSPALDVLPEEDGERLFKIAIAGVVAEHMEAMEPASQRLGRDDWTEDVRRVLKLARTNRIVPEQLLACARISWESLESFFGETDLSSDLDEELDEAVADAITVLETLEYPSKSTLKVFDDLKKFKIQREKASSETTWGDWLRISKLIDKAANDGKPYLEEVSATAGRVLAHPLFRNDVKQVIEGVYSSAADSLVAYENFKRKQGLIDFTDQEVKVLELLESSETFRDSMKDRLSRIMVDEFQDTNPIQLALFMALHALTGHSTWVGDPKQAIYGFRGTDSQLMDSAGALVENPQILEYSWRSRELLVRFCNAVYSRVFRDMGEGKVCLRIPPVRAEEASGGELELWLLSSSNASNDALTIAEGIRDLLINDAAVEPGDIAVLCRTNEQCESVSAALEALNVRASVPQGSLLGTPECLLAIAALRYTLDINDTLALTEVVRLSPLHADHETWLDSVILDKDEAISRWEKDPTVETLLRARESLKYQTPLETLKDAIDGVNLPRIVKSWNNPKRRMNNLDWLCEICVQYMDQCKARRAAATAMGFIHYLRESEPGQAEGFGRHTVRVSTWHGAKGLEWPIVVLTGLDHSREATPFGAHIVPAPHFDPAQPLAGRSIRFWPWAFGTQKKYPELEERMAGAYECEFIKEQAAKESRRLLYVGMTRARDRMIFAARRNETKSSVNLRTAWIDELSCESGNPLIRWPLHEGRQELDVDGEKFPITVRMFSPPEEQVFIEKEEQEQFTFKSAESEKQRPSARIAPSELEADEALLSGVAVEDVTDFGTRIPIRGKPDYAALGCAIHGFFAVDSHPYERRLEIAGHLLNCWNVDDSVDPADVLAADDRLRQFIAQQYPMAKAFREWPVSYLNEKQQRVQGWIDLLLELPDGYIIIDHKTTPNAGREHIKSYAPQLMAYKEAIELATGKKVIETLIHLPVCGLVVKVML